MELLPSEGSRCCGLQGRNSASPRESLPRLCPAQPSPAQLSLMFVMKRGLLVGASLLFLNRNYFSLRCSGRFVSAFLYSLIYLLRRAANYSCLNSVLGCGSCWLAG